MQGNTLKDSNRGKKSPSCSAYVITEEGVHNKVEELVNLGKYKSLGNTRDCGYTILVILKNTLTGVPQLPRVFVKVSRLRQHESSCYTGTLYFLRLLTKQQVTAIIDVKSVIFFN